MDYSLDFNTHEQLQESLKTFNKILNEKSSYNFNFAQNSDTYKLNCLILKSLQGKNVAINSNASSDSLVLGNIRMWQSAYGYQTNGTLTYDQARELIDTAYTNANDNIELEPLLNTDANNVSSSVSAHYDPFFLNSSGKIFRKNHKDIIISLGNGEYEKVIKDVFMRSVSVQVDTSGNPVSEVYSFIARDIKESDASEDANKYNGTEEIASSSSDIKYSYGSLYKDK